MKKFLVCVCLMLMTVLLFGCENATEIEAGFISAISSPASETQAVKITFAKDSRLEGKGVDCQIRFDKAGQVVLWLDGDEKIEFQVEKYDYWYSLATIIADNKDKPLIFEEFDQALSKTLLFQSEVAQEVSIRVVAGQREPDFDNEGEVLVASEPISKQFRLKIGKK